MDYDTVIIGAGLAGVTIGALLAHDGRKVLIVERRAILGGRLATVRHTMPTGAAMRFDASAEPLYGFAPGAVFERLARRLALRFSVLPIPALPAIHFGDARIDDIRSRFAEPAVVRFIESQSALAAVLTRWLDRVPALPLETPGDFLRILPTLRPELVELLPHRERTVAHELRRRQVRDPQVHALVTALLLSNGLSQPERTSWLAGSLALDALQQPTFYAAGGNGAVVATLADAFIRDGGDLRYVSEVIKLDVRNERVSGVRLHDGTLVTARQVIYSGALDRLPELLAAGGALQLERRITRLPRSAGRYNLGLVLSSAEALTPLHHLFVGDPQRPLSDGNLVQISVHPRGDGTRAPVGMYAATVSALLAAEVDLDQVPREALQSRISAALARVLPHVQVTSSVELLPQAAQRRGLGLRSGGIDGLWVLDAGAWPGPHSLAAAQSAVRLYRVLRWRRP